LFAAVAGRRALTPPLQRVALLQRIKLQSAGVDEVELFPKPTLAARDAKEPAEGRRPSRLEYRMQRMKELQLANEVRASAWDQEHAVEKSEMHGTSAQKRYLQKSDTKRRAREILGGF